MAEETQYTAKMGAARISVANPKLDGTGATYGLITGATNGTLIKSVSIKATGNVSNGMIRFFIKRANTAYLLLEVPVIESRPTGVTPAFETQITLDRTLAPGSVLHVSTQLAENFSITAECADWAYYASAVRPDTTQTTANIGAVTIATANPNLDGTGTLGTAYTAGSSATFKGSSIRSITIKSVAPVSPGMIRVFLEDVSTNIYLLTEIEVSAEGQAATTEAFERTILFDDDLDIPAGYMIKVSTEVAQTFNIIVEGTDWNYAA